MKGTFFIYAFTLIMACSCTSAPAGITPIGGFELDRYLGKWHEIARLDHSFERGLGPVTAEYSMREDGGVKVINRGWSAEDKRWEEAIGKAYFVDSVDKGHLKVSFFGPFYGAYIIFELDADYHYAFIAGPDRDYLWLLSRTPQISPALREHFMQRATSLGFDTTQLIFPADP